MLRSSSVLALLLLSFCSYAGKNDMPAYNAATIPASLKKDAHAVVRSCSTRIKVNSPTDIKWYSKYAYTILDDKGYKHAMLDEKFTNMFKVTSVSGRLFDAAGNELKSIKNRDVKEEAILSYSIADDLKRKYYDFHYANYPFTVEYEVETAITSLFFVDEYIFADDYNCSVEVSDLEIEYPADMQLVYKLMHTDVPVLQTKEGELAKLKVSVKDIPAIKRDPLAVPELYKQAAMMLSFDKMVLGGVSGSMHTWADYGRLFYDLNKDRDVLSDDAKQKVHQLTDTCKSIGGKVNVLFDYMKNNTRYVSIQLGVGGWQTFDAASVLKTGYGDCKALTNCMKAMLKEAGVVAYAALIYGDEDAPPLLDKDVPVNAFNHVILCIPQARDTVWVECTSDDLQPGYLSEFTHNRNALLVTDKGGVLVKTPVYGHKQNTINRKVDVKMNVVGDVNVAVSVQHSGEFAQKALDKYKTGVKSDIDKMLYSRIDLPSPQLVNATHEALPAASYPVLKENIEYTGTARVNITGKRVFLQPLISSVKKASIAPLGTRTTPFYISEGYAITDTLVYSFAEKLSPEMLPQPIVFEKPFGKYTLKASFENQQLKIVRTMEQYMGEYPANVYEEYLELLGYAALNNDDMNAVFVKQ